MAPFISTSASKPKPAWHISNLTNFDIRFADSPANEVVIEATKNATHSAQGGKFRKDATLMAAGPDSSVEEKQSFTLKRPSLLGSSSKWTEMRLVSNSSNKEHVEAPFRAFQVKASSVDQRLLVVPNRNMASYLKDIPDSVHLSNILLPGTHDSMAIYGFPFAQCQRQPLLTQLRAGIRVIDVRLAIVNATTLTSFHGVINQKTLFSDILATLYAFLQSEEGKSECVVMSIKQEDFATNPAALFSQLVHDAIFGSSLAGNLKDKGIRKDTTGGEPLPPHSPTAAATSSSRSMWYLENRVPNLGQVRGKIILFSRFGDGTGWENGIEGMGIWNTRWPNSVIPGWNWDVKDTTFQSQDWYDIGSFSKAPEKFALATSTLITRPSPSDPTSKSHHIIPMSFASASTLPFALPSAVALGIGILQIGFAGVNARISQWALDILSSDNPSAAMLSPLSLPQPKVDANKGKKGPATADSNVNQTKSEEVKAAEQAPPDNRLTRISGWLLMDYYDSPGDMIRFLVELNFLNQRLGVQVAPVQATSEITTS
ncbi:hypothetical protein FRC01_003448 [Tulasnella sp. 417]|nr:hypothetical protein FRC01_003448 [Tulasnella sp. 417]